MKKKNDRRSFIRNLTLGGLAASTSSQILAASETSAEALIKNSTEEKVEELEKVDNKLNLRKYNAPYEGDYLNRVAFPIGGIGAGMICMEGVGAISHVSVRNKPEMFNEPGMFAAIALKGRPNGAKVIEGQVYDWKMFGRPGASNGSPGTTYGLPRFNTAKFTTRFPFATIDLRDDDIPMDVRITGWSPFIPTDNDNSSLPVGAFEYRFKNTSAQTLDAVFSYNSRNFIQQAQKGSIGKIKNGFVLSQDAIDKKASTKGDFAIFTDQANTVVDHCWFRGGWWDPLTMAWNTIKEGLVKSNDPVENGAPGASLFVPFKLTPGEVKTIRLMMSWYVPDTDLTLADHPDKNSKPYGLTPADIGLDGDYRKYPAETHKPWYSNKFKTIAEVANYWTLNYDMLKKNSSLFSDAFYSSSLPPEVVEAVAANLTILKSPTVLRQYDGRLWNYEGCRDEVGCCIGTCTHVWNYAQAIAHLFPSLERSLRNTEFCENQDDEGHQSFRASLPIRPTNHNFHAAADGQLGGIMKTYRDWRISGDTEWLKKLYRLVEKSMNFCIKEWDPRNRGVLEEPHHNTYDIEFWGPDGMCTSYYLGALKAMMEMGRHLKKDVSIYQSLYDKGKKYIETELFDGEYFIQKIQTEGLNAANPAKGDTKRPKADYSEEAIKLLQKEGPKYQYGVGCLSDGILGVWLSRMCMLENTVDTKKVRSHLNAVYKYNFKKDLRDHANPQRPSYALGKEAGLILCTWPKGGKLSLPFVYSDEVWTGIEYQVASHLMLNGDINKGFDIVRACRDRYDGTKRNPFNEYECGHWYGRAQSSYGFLHSLTGVQFDAVDKTLHIDSKVGDFNSFLSTETGFGTVQLKNGKPSLKVYYGSIPVYKVLVSGKEVKLATS